MPPLRIGILGAARIAPQALINPIKQNSDLAERAIVVSVAARDTSKAAQFAAEHAIPRTHASYEDLLADPGIDAVYNPSPNSYHAQLTIKALQVPSSYASKCLTIIIPSIAAATAFADDQLHRHSPGSTCYAKSRSPTMQLRQLPYSVPARTQAKSRLRPFIRYTTPWPIGHASWWC